MKQPMETACPGRWLTEGVPDRKFPEGAMDPVAAMRLITQELVLDGIPERNLATFVTTWMEPEAQSVIAENLHRNFIDHAEYPQTAEIEQRCIRMLADLFNAPGRDDRRPDPGLVRGDHARRPVAEVEMAPATRGSRQVDRPAEPGLRRRRARRLGEVLPLLRRRAADRPAAARQVHDRPGGHRAPRRREHDRGRRGARDDVHRACRRRHRDQRLPRRTADDKGLDVPLHIDGASGGFVWPFLYPRLRVGLPARAGAVDQRLGPQVRPRLSRGSAG